MKTMFFRVSVEWDSGHGRIDNSRKYAKIEDAITYIKGISKHSKIYKAHIEYEEREVK